MCFFSVHSVFISVGKTVWSPTWPYLSALAKCSITLTLTIRSWQLRIKWKWIFLLANIHVYSNTLKNSHVKSFCIYIVPCKYSNRSAFANVIINKLDGQTSWPNATFWGMRTQLGYDPTFELGRDFCTVRLPASFIILCLHVRKLSCWQTNKQTNRRRWINPTFFARYDVG